MYVYTTSNTASQKTKNKGKLEVPITLTAAVHAIMQTEFQVRLSINALYTAKGKEMSNTDKSTSK